MIAAGAHPATDGTLRRGNRLRRPRATWLLFAALLGSQATRSQQDDVAPRPGPDSLSSDRIESARVALIERISRTVVCIFDPLQRGGGSGVIIDEDGRGLTNFHVVADMLAERKGLAALNTGHMYDLEVLGVDPGGDMAMFRLVGPRGGDAEPASAGAYSFARLGDSRRVRPGDPVLALGNPFVLAEDYTPTVTLGRVTGVHRYQYGEGNQLLYSDCIQTDAAINPGNSGGPLFNMDGDVIGINGRISINTRGRFNVGVGYAISSNQIARFLPGLRAGLHVRHGTLQATVVDRRGAVIFDRMLDDAPAWNAGIRPGDRLLSFDGLGIESANHFASLLGTYPEGWRVKLEFERDGQRREAEARLEPLPVKLPVPFETDTELSASAQGIQPPSEGPGAAAPPLPATGESPAPESPQTAPSFRIESALERTVKLYGLGAGMEVGYGAGVLVSPRGEVLTVLSLLVEARRLTAVTRDGTMYDAIVVHRDTNRQLVLLELKPREIEPASESVRAAPVDVAEPAPAGGQSATLPPFPHFDLDLDAPVLPGEPVVALGNPFRIADGREPLSLAHGVVSARIRLDATRRAKEYPYHGEVLIVDAITSNPGFAGGALVNAQGQFVGMIGREVRLNLTRTHLNYAMPVDALRAFLREARGGAPAVTASRIHQDIGIRLVATGYRTTLPFVDRVVAGSPAARAGVRADDLVLAVGGREVSDARMYEQIVEGLAAPLDVEIIVRRGRDMLTLRIQSDEGG